MGKVARFTKADIKRAASGMAAAGFRNMRVEIDPNGKIVILTEQPNQRRDGEGWEDLE
ncbi:hypothetical protein N6H05_14940 [Sphingobium sp. WTD-1]|uniref:hypothetical protein n=1 Tax=unclassified Sphingobium TaxID=2611147 RepID=UPI0024DE347B|nr:MULTISPECIES: hypothetical protein [unclassified Sphingobium]MBR2268745.1 hypothetical protein [Sphingobium sp.]WIA54361.1 hypothetical protein N6H05_14940 [Sphingobium sp. WTD-1]